MFSFITGKVLGVFMNFFAFYIQHIHKYNGVIFYIENLNLDFVSVVPFSISRIGLLVIKLLGFLLTPLINPCGIIPYTYAM